MRYVPAVCGGANTMQFDERLGKVVPVAEACGFGDFVDRLFGMR